MISHVLPIFLQFHSHYITILVSYLISFIWGVTVAFWGSGPRSRAMCVPPAHLEIRLPVVNERLWTSPSSPLQGRRILPKCSMYGISTYIWAILGVNVSKYSIHCNTWSISVGSVPPSNASRLIPKLPSPLWSDCAERNLKKHLSWLLPFGYPELSAAVSAQQPQEIPSGKSLHHYERSVMFHWKIHYFDGNFH